MIDKCEVGGRRCGHGCACLGELDGVLGLDHGLLRQPVLYGRHSHELILGVLDIYMAEAGLGVCSWSASAPISTLCIPVRGSKG